MDLTQVSEFFECLRHVPTPYQDFNIVRVESTSTHLFHSVLPASKCKLPYFLLTKQCAIKEDSKVFEDDDESVDGSPLKLQEFDIPQTFVNENGEAYCAMPMKEACRIVSLYTIGLQQNEELKEVLPLWVLCDESSSAVLYDDSTIALGVVIVREGGKLNVCTTVATAHGPMEKAPESPSVQSLIKHHGAMNHRSVSSVCKASYNVYRTMATNISGFCEQGSLVIHLEWKKCSSLLQMPPPDASCHVHAVVGNGDIRSPAHFMFIELGMIERIANGIHNNHMEWEVCENEHEMESIHKQVSELINKAKIMNITSENKGAKEERVSSPLKNVFLVERKNLDFTEQLWNILKHCGSYNELHASLTSVLTSLQQGSYQPMLHRANKTRLAGMIRDSFSKKLVMPILTGLLPLELLLEVGIGKIQRDYSNQMISQELVTAADLQYFVAGGGDVDVLEQCDRLAKLHVVLELVVMLEHYLMLPRDTLRCAARKALVHLSRTAAAATAATAAAATAAASADARQEYVIPVSFGCVSHQLAQLQPTAWSLCLEEASGGAHCVYHMAPTCPLEHVMSDAIVGGNTSQAETLASVSEEKQQYMLTILTEYNMLC